MLLEDFNKIYRYKSDKDKYNTNLDIWEVPTVNNNIVESDCESYCRFLKHNVVGFEDWKYWYCKINGNGHCILFKNNDVIDCNIKRIVTLEQYCKMYRVTELRKYSLFEVVSKIIVSKIITKIILPIRNTIKF